MKKLFSKIAAILTAACMLPAIPANAASSFEYMAEGWSKSYTGMTGTDFEGTGSIEYSTSVGLDDTSSMAVSGTYTWSASSGTVKMTIDSDSFDVPAGEYTYSFSIKRINTEKGMGNGDLHMYINGARSERIIANVNPNSPSDNMDSYTDDENGWRTYTKKVTLTEKTGAHISMYFLSAPNMYIDNVSLKDASGKEYVPNGDFSEYTKSEVDLVNSDVAPAEWYENNYKWTTEGTEGSYMKLNRTVSNSGEASMHIYTTYSYVSGGPSMRLYTTPYTFDTSKTYTVTIYTKNTTGLGSIHVNLAGKNVTLNNFVQETQDNGWVKRTYDYKPNSAKGPMIIQAYTTTDMYFDDISVVDNETGKNMILNGDFEEYVEGVIPSENNGKLANCWEVTTKLGASVAAFSEKAVSEVSELEAHTGSHSWALAYPEVHNDTWYGVRTESISVPAGSYTLTLYTKGAYKPYSLFLAFANSEWVSGGYGYLSEDNNTGFTISKIEADEDGWKKWTIPVTLGSAANNFEFKLVAQRGAVPYFYIDDISLTDANGVEYMTNGGFEDLANTTDLERVMAYDANSGTAGTITWVNPLNDNIDSITMKVNGENYEITPDLTSEAFNEVILADLTTGSVYDVELILTIGDVTKTYTTQLNPHQAEHTIGAWAVDRVDGYDRADAAKSGYANTVVAIDRGVGYNSNSSLKLVSNRDGYRDHTTFRFGQKAAVNNGSEYVFSYKVKADDLRDESYSLYLIAGNATDKTTPPTAAKDKVNNGDGWYTYTYNLIATADTMTLQLAVRDWIGVAYVDDVNLQLLDPDEAVPVGDNLLKDGDFEFAGYTVTNAPKVEMYVDGYGWAEVTEIETAGKYRAIADIKNYSEADLEASIFLAVYEGGKLVEVVPGKFDVPENDWVPTTLTADTTVDSADVTIKAMLWDGADTLTPLAPAAVAAPIVTE